jgi:eukaryotic-like serine/threonine-protein kinase
MGKTTAALIEALLHAKPVPVRDRNANVSDALASLIERAVQRRPEDRQQSAAELATKLRELTLNQSAVVYTTRKTKPVLLAIVTLVAALIAFYVLRIQRPTIPRIVVAQATDLAGQELFPSISPDGKVFVFAGNQQGSWDIYSQRISGRNMTNLTADFTGDDTQPSFSPDGDRIAFRSERQGGGIFVMGATGESVRKVTDLGFNPSWSPDGKQVVVATESITDAANRGRVSELWVIDVDTGRKRRVFSGDSVQPSWSPHGDRIAFWAGVSGRREIRTVSANGEQPKAAIANGDVNWNPVWSSDGRFLYYLTNRGGSTNVWRTRIDERSGAILQAPDPVTTPATDALHLSLARNAPRGVYVQRFTAANLHKARFESYKTLGKPVQITRGTRMLISPDVSADGEWIVYGTGGMQEDIYLSRVDGSGRRQLTNDSYKDRRPRWSPDGRRLTFDSNRSGRVEIWQINFDGSGLSKLTHNEEPAAILPTWSPTGEKLIFSRPGASPGILNLSSFETSPLPALASPDVWRGVTSWSPDGGHLAFHMIRPGKGPSGIGIYALNSGRIVQLANRGDTPIWLADSRHLLYQNGPELHLVDTASRADRIVMHNEPYDFELGNRSGGLRDWLYFSLISTEADVWTFKLQ